jgi:hypothetical protein
MAQMCWGVRGLSAEQPKTTRPPFLIRGGPELIIGYVVDLGANLWGRSEEGKTASIRAGRIHYEAQCQSKHGCSHPAMIGHVEQLAGDSIL